MSTSSLIGSQRFTKLSDGTSSTESISFDPDSTSSSRLTRCSSVPTTRDSPDTNASRSTTRSRSVESSYHRSRRRTVTPRTCYPYRTPSPDRDLILAPQSREASGWLSCQGVAWFWVFLMLTIACITAITIAPGLQHDLETTAEMASVMRVIERDIQVLDSYLDYLVRNITLMHVYGLQEIDSMSLRILDVRQWLNQFSECR